MNDTLLKITVENKDTNFILNIKKALAKVSYYLKVLPDWIDNTLHELTMVKTFFL